MAVSGWIPNLSQRLAQLEKVAQLGSFTGLTVWLGGLFFPEAYITATRQAVAHRMSWSLETLDLRLDVEQEGDPTAFAVEGKLTYLPDTGPYSNKMHKASSSKVLPGRTTTLPSTRARRSLSVVHRSDGSI